MYQTPTQSATEMIWVEDEGIAREVDYGKVLHTNNRHVAFPSWSMDEVKRLVEEEGRVLIVIKNRVYDIGRWARYHPGGIRALYHSAGKDVTDQFIQMHTLAAHRKLKNFIVAVIDQKDRDKRAAQALQRDWDNFTQSILKEGIYESNYYYFVGEFVRSILFLGACLLLSRSDVVRGESTWAHMLGAMCFGMFLQQMSFLGHDAGHNGITHNSKIDTAIGIIVGNLLTGVGIGWWKESHNNHHVVCNSIDNDADIQHMPFICCNPAIMDKPFFSTWNLNWHDARWFVACYLLRVQHIIYYPTVMGLARYNLYVQSWMYILSGKSKMPLTEAAALVGFVAWVSAMVTLVPSVYGRVSFVMISHAVAGILNIQITLSHFCMEVYYGSPYNHKKGIEDGWVWTQMKTTLSLVCPPWLDWFHGGLQFQDVHHLLPRVPRHNLRQLRPRIRALCHKHGCRVSPECGFIDANIMTMKLIHCCAKKAWSLKPTIDSNTELRQSPLFDTLFARG